ncbi:MAG: hypothetical protein JJE50_13280 [Actinomycetales bacterium]|nr:hypothetical protein [Actinomycetales bacterium]
MSSFPGVLLHVVLSLGARRSDVAVSSDALVGDVLRASGVAVTSGVQAVFVVICIAIGLAAARVLTDRAWAYEQ